MSNNNTSRSSWFVTFMSFSVLLASLSTWHSSQVHKRRLHEQRDALHEQRDALSKYYGAMDEAYKAAHPDPSNRPEGHEFDDLTEDRMCGSDKDFELFQFDLWVSMRYPYKVQCQEPIRQSMSLPPPPSVIVPPPV